MRLALVPSSTVAPCHRRPATCCSSQQLASQPTQRQQAWRTGSSSGGGRRQQRQAAAAAAREEQELTAGGTADAELQPSSSYSSPEQDEEDESRDFAVAMAKVAWETKAEDILVLHVAPVVYWTRYMLICTVFSRPQLNAILGKMVKEAEQAHGRTLSVNPTANSGGWELLDYGDVVVHILTAEQRDYYDLETFYGAAEEVPLPFEEAAADVDTWTKKL